MSSPLETRDALVDSIVKKAGERGLWAVQSRRADGSIGAGDLRNIRYSFMSRFCRLTPGYDDPMGWHRWYRDHRVLPYTWRTDLSKEENAA